MVHILKEGLRDIINMKVKRGSVLLVVGFCTISSYHTDNPTISQGDPIGLASDKDKKTIVQHLGFKYPNSNTSITLRI